MRGCYNQRPGEPLSVTGQPKAIPSGLSGRDRDGKDGPRVRATLRRVPVVISSTCHPSSTTNLVRPVSVTPVSTPTSRGARSSGPTGTAFSTRCRRCVTRGPSTCPERVSHLSSFVEVNASPAWTSPSFTRLLPHLSENLFRPTERRRGLPVRYPSRVSSGTRNLRLSTPTLGLR